MSEKSDKKAIEIVSFLLGLATLTASVCFGIFVGNLYGVEAGIAAGVGYLLVARRVNVG